MYACVYVYALCCVCACIYVCIYNHTHAHTCMHTTIHAYIPMPTVHDNIQVYRSVYDF